MIIIVAAALAVNTAIITHICLTLKWDEQTLRELQERKNDNK